jgi:carbonic anhydrase/acetyltransferase-like protein (isoleucine patch superfamily)
VPFNPRLRDTPALDIVAPLKGQAGFVAPNAKVIGNVTLGSQVSIWYGAVLRGEHKMTRFAAAVLHRGVLFLVWLVAGGYLVGGLVGSQMHVAVTAILV